MIKCKNCGAGMRFDIDKQMLVCDYCDTCLPVENKNQADITSETQLLDGIIYTCPQCGAELFTTEETAATFCSYCGSSVLLESRLAAVNKPDYIIPFKITQEEAQEAYKKKLKNAIFAPSSVKKAEIEAIRGIYMPYWEYYMTGKSEYKFKYNTNERAEGGYAYHDQNELSFNAILKCDGLEYDASSALPDDLSQAYAPYYFKESKLFSPGYMSGFYADLGDVPAQTYENSALDTAATVIASEIGEHINADKYDIFNKTIKDQIVFDDVTPGLAMYPVWFTCARSANDKFITYAAINGQSGKVAADLPIDRKKILLGTLLLTIPIFAALVFIITPTPLMTLAIVAALSVVGTCIASHEIKKILSDTGHIQEGEQSKFKRKRSFIIVRTIIGIALCVLIYLISPVEDYYYYAAAIISSVLCLINFWTAFGLYNRSIQRVLPQLNKRGGDK